MKSLGFSSDGRPVALKEWAVTVKALIEGTQILVLRKGGISEETRDFELVSPAFFLLPAYEHQKPELLKEVYQPQIKQIMEEWQPESDEIEIRAFAKVVEDMEIRDQESLDRIREYHIWTDEFAEERLKWKRSKPLHLLLLRVSVLEQPVHIPVRPAYTGCKSWVAIEEDISEQAAAEVLDDIAFNEQVAEIKRLLAL
ncbi:hypothetical protein Back11_28710 [Paenibacillus baekrokdamisoli]|uniref:Uncharacterized protein n=1 Tax=Paenibacillus baekrokdamisoli TaxID=1712516 RepID=A0A3G9IT14_9BACL|nr:DUF1802 family protein [Paenibacillus baekrokdamisoli]MBB3071108.1 hypothetical protein [Paenibacillus baekrokdamisoli]BBH21526.1 hypothetical protein Back11_28710 [Paenibacillus baekrokdamisoli]